MSGEYHVWDSSHLGQRFEVKTYGTRGKAMIVFPSSDGRFFDYENFGMIEPCRPWIESGKLRVISVDGRDWETFNNASAHPSDRARRYAQWEACVIDEVLPKFGLIGPSASGGGLIVTGCSFGSFHAANFALRHPQLCDAAILLSGIYSLRHYLGDYCDDQVYFFDPRHYLPNLTDERQLAAIRKVRLILCCGQGPHEEECLAETRHFSSLLNEKRIPHWLDLWGYDVAHDWPWWREQLHYFLEKLNL
ncbi:MAG: esterase family protein [Phycisphaerae bacterium]|nr:esterase family protein [Phycisphaerae bacterium]